MNQDVSPRKRRWLWFVLGTIVAVPVVVISICSVIFFVNRLRPDQIDVPGGMLKVAVAPAEAASHDWTGTSVTRARAPLAPPKADEKIVAIRKKEADFLSAHWDRKKMTEESPVLESLMKRRAGEPLTKEQAQWLRDHQDLIQSLLRLAAAGGAPAMTCEQAALLGPNEIRNLTVPKFQDYLDYARLLSAEGQRRFDAGDVAGAVEALTAINPLAQSISEPTLICYLVGNAMQAISQAELGRWISDRAISGDTARQLQSQLAAQIADNSRLRGTLELEYTVGRGLMVDALSGSFLDTINYNMNQTMYWANNGNANDWSLWNEIYSNPFRTATSMYDASTLAVYMKCNAATIVDNYDDFYRQGFNYIETGQPINPNGPVPNAVNIEECRVRACRNAANLELGIMGLDIASGVTPAEQPDPFIDQPIKSIERDDSTWIYSVGPDGTDQQGAISYDPTNGLISGGDICMKIRKNQ